MDGNEFTMIVTQTGNQVTGSASIVGASFPVTSTFDPPRWTGLVGRTGYGLMFDVTVNGDHAVGTISAGDGGTQSTTMDRGE